MTFTDPGVALQQVIFEALKASTALGALVSGRIYDRVPRKQNGDVNAEFPFVNFGELQVIPEIAECTDAAESFVTIHSWSVKVGSVEAKQINAAIAAALHDAALAGVQSILLQDSRVVPDPDGLTSHGILVFHVLTDAN